MGRADIPTDAQALALARCWSGTPIQVGGYDTPTTKVLVKKAWIGPRGSGGTYPSGTAYRDYIITDAGLDAIENYLRQKRCERLS